MPVQIGFKSDPVIVQSSIYNAVSALFNRQLNVRGTPDAFLLEQCTKDTIFS